MTEFRQIGDVMTEVLVRCWSVAAANTDDEQHALELRQAVAELREPIKEAA